MALTTRCGVEMLAAWVKRGKWTALRRSRGKEREMREGILVEKMVGVDGEKT